MKRSLFAIAALIFLLCGCELDDAALPPTAPAAPEAESVPVNKTFGVGYASGEDTDPYTTKNKLNAELCALLCEGLFEVDESFAAQPVLCESYSADGLVYTLKVKGGITFADGSPLTAEDVDYSLHAAMQADSYYANRLSLISRIRTRGTNTVIITLTRENGRLPALLDVPIIKNGSRGDGTFPNGTGQYIPAEDGKSLVAKSGHHSGKKPLYSTISLIDTDSTDALIFEFESSRVSLLSSDPTASAPLTRSGAFESRNIPTTQLQYIGFNMRKPLFADSSVRRAISRAIDRASAVEQDFALMGEVTALPIHPKCSVQYPEIASALSYSEDTATLPEGTVTILVNSENSGRLAVCKRIAEALTARGMATSVRAETFDKYTAALQAGDFDMYYAEVNLGADFDLTRLITPGGSLNYGAFSDTALTSAHAAYLASDEAAGAFFEKFAALLPIAPVMFRDTAVDLQNGAFADIHSTQRNLYYHLSGWTLAE